MCRGAKALLDRGKLRLGTSDSFFLDRLAGVYATDVTTASRTSLMNLDTGQWDPELCRLFGVPHGGAAGDPLHRGLVRHRSAGSPSPPASADQQAALFGHGCRRAGQAKITFGTGAFALAVADRNIAADRADGMSRTVAWKIGNAPIAYAIEGGVYDAASAINWARGLGLFESYAEIDDFADAARDRARHRLRAGAVGTRRTLLGPQRRGHVARPRPRQHARPT